jgi:hypothetical protein
LVVAEQGVQVVKEKLVEQMVNHMAMDKKWVELFLV